MNQLEQLYDNFEMTWNPLVSLQEISRTIDDWPDQRDEVGLELAIIDLSKRWQAWSQLAEQNLHCIEGLCSIRSKIPDWYTYETTLNLSQAKRATLQWWEYDSRVEFGDCPPQWKYSNSDATRLPQSKLPQIRVFGKRGEHLRCAFKGPLIIGRQAKDDPKPVRLQEITDDQKLKLVIVDTDDRSVSRNQISISMIARRVVRVENISVNRTVGFHASATNCDQQILAPGETLYAKLPLRFPLVHNVELSRD